MALHTIVEHDTTHIKPYIDKVKQELNNEVTTRAELGAHNLGKKYNGVSNIGLTIKDAPDGGNYVNGTATTSGGRLNLKSENFVLKAGTYTIVGESNDHSKYSTVVLQKTSDNSVLGLYEISNGAVDKSQATVTLAADTECYFGFNTFNGTAYGTDTFIIYPMVKLADDKDDTFYPYAKPNTELTKDTIGLSENAFANGCVNLLENTGTDTVQEGVAFTFNSDGSIKAYGTLGANKNAVVTIHSPDIFPNMVGKRVKLSGCPKVTGFSTRVTAYRVESVDGSSGSVFDTGDGVTFDFLNNGTGTKAQFYIEIGNLTSSPISINTTYKPMITLADVPNSDYAHYVPYAKSNKELTNYTNPIDIAFTPTDATKATLDWGKFYRVGDIVMANVGFLVQNITAGDTVSLGTIPVQSTTPVVSPVCDGYLTKDYAGYIRFMHNQNTIEYFAAKTADTMRVCGTLIFKVKS